MIDKIAIICIILCIIEIIYFIYKYIDNKKNGKKVTIFNLIIKIIGVGTMIFMGGGLFLIFYVIYWCGSQF